MKFVKNDGSELHLLEDFSVVKKDSSPIKEIMSRQDLSDYTFFDIVEVPLSAITQIQVNIIDVGVVGFVFKASDFEKEAFINEVSKLKELKITSFYDALNKVKALFQTSKSFNPLFAIYSPNGKWKIYEDCFRTMDINVKLVYISEEGNSTAISKEANPVSINTDAPKEKTKFKFTNPFPIIAKDKFHFMFALIATLLIGFTLSIGIYDAYSGKMLCIFFFICALAGSFLNFMIYKDTFKNNRIISMYSIITFVSSILGLSLSVALYFLFKKISSDKPAIEPKIIMILGIAILVVALSCGVAYIVSYLKKKKK